MSTNLVVDGLVKRMGRNFYDKWVWQAWLADTRGLSLLAKGFWHELLNIMMDRDVYSLTDTIEGFARLTGGLPAEVVAATAEMEKQRVATVIRHPNEQVTVVSRRRQREFNNRKANRLRQQRHRNNGDVTVVSQDSNCSSDSGSEVVSNGDGAEGGRKPPWTRELFDAAARNAGVSQKDAELCWAHYDSQGWQFPNKIPVTGDPRSLLVRWTTKQERRNGDGEGREDISAGRSKCHAQGNGKREAWKVQADLESAKELRKKQLSPSRYGYGDSLGMARVKAERGDAQAKTDLAAYERLGTRIKELEAELAQCI